MKNIVVTVKDTARHEIDVVAQRLSAAGMQVARVMGTTGVITGAISEHLTPALGLIDGVFAVEAEGSIQLPPPDSAVQ